jgi:hypothetical protein
MWPESDVTARETVPVAHEFVNHVVQFRRQAAAMSPARSSRKHGTILHVPFQRTPIRHYARRFECQLGTSAAVLHSR